MRSARGVSCATILFIAAAACRSDSGSTPGLDAAPATLTLTAANVRQLSRVGPTSPMTGNRFVAATITLKNLGEATPVPVNASTLVVETADRLRYPASAKGVLLAEPCPSTVSIAPGGTLSCEVLFEIPWAAIPTGIAYDDSKGRTAEARIAEVAPAKSLCEGLPMTPSCSGCLSDASNCRPTAGALREACDMEIFSTCVLPDACPSVRSICSPSVACQIAIDAQQGCLFDQCSPYCT